MNWVESDGPESHLFLFGFNFFSLRYTLNSYVSDALASAPTEFQHWAFVKNGTQCDLYINGNSVIQFTNDVSSKTPAKFYIGCNFAGYTTSEWPGVIDELRITKGIARYTANFTPPTAPFPNE